MTKRGTRSSVTRVRIKLDRGWRVSCDACSTIFDISYRMNATRAQKPKYCSKECKVTDHKERSNDPIRIAMRFWSFVAKRGPDDCWEWQGCRRSLGYGWFNFAGRSMTAHRAAYILTYGAIVNAKEYVCHSCDNPPCCNPAHLWLGDVKANTQDMDRKGRRVIKVLHGESHSQAKLTTAQVLEVYTSDEPATVIGKRLGVTSAAILLIRHGKTWRHVTGAQRG